MRCREAQLSGNLLQTYLLVKAAELAEFFGDGHTLQVLVVAYRLEVPAYQEQIDLVVVSRFETSNVLIYRV